MKGGKHITTFERGIPKRTRKRTLPPSGGEKGKDRTLGRKGEVQESLPSSISKRGPLLARKAGRGENWKV